MRGFGLMKPRWSVVLSWPGTIHADQKRLTDYLVASGMTGTMMKGLLRVPLPPRPKSRICWKTFLQYCRLKASEEVPFSLHAQDELSRLFSRLVEILIGLRCGLETSEGDLLSEVMGDADLLMARVDAFRECSLGAPRKPAFALPPHHPCIERSWMQSNGPAEYARKVVRGNPRKGCWSLGFS